MAITLTLEERLNAQDATATPWGGVGSELDKKPFEKDIAGGGYSGLPFIKQTVPKTLGQYFSLTTEALSLDYPIRGGSYEELATRRDFARIDRFVLYHPQGTAFRDKQIQLAKSNPRIETATSGYLSQNQIYSLPNLFHNLTAGNTGFHYPNIGTEKQIMDGMINYYNTYGSIAAHKPVSSNRLAVLWKNKILSPQEANSETLQGSNNPFDTSQRESDINTFINSFTAINSLNESLGGGVDESTAATIDLNITPDRRDPFLIKYQGGPDSRYGDGETAILRGTDARGAIIVSGRNYPDNSIKYFVGNNSTTDVYGKTVQGRPLTQFTWDNLLGASLQYSSGIDNQITTEGNPNYLVQTNGASFTKAETDTVVPEYRELFSNTLKYNQILAQKSENGEQFNYRDFRSQITGQPSENYYEFNMPKRLGTGDVGRRTAAQRKNPSIVVTNTIDKINASDIITRTLDKKTGAVQGTHERDLIKFRFGTLRNDGDSANLMYFRAFISDYNDSHSAQWDQKRYTGRGENLYTYQGYDRTITFSFKVAAQTRQEMKPLWKKLNYLVSNIYPDYSANQFMRGNITLLTLGDLFFDTPGILTDVQLSVQNNYPWEIAMKDPELDSVGGGTMKEIPQICDVAVTFKPILKTLPRHDFLNKNSKILFTDNTADRNNQWLTPVEELQDSRTPIRPVNEITPVDFIDQVSNEEQQESERRIRFNNLTGAEGLIA